MRRSGSALLAAALLCISTTTASAGDRPPGALPDAVVATGEGPVRRAWLAEPTERYPHGVLGDAIEAGALMAELAGGRILGIRLSDETVFEDRHVRLADFNGDGVDEMVVVESHLEHGAALAIYGIREGRIQLVLRDAWIGQANRWLNPAGIADFDGDGRLEIAIVVTPHIGGTLKLLRPGVKGFETVASLPGYSNHAIGSREQGLSFVADVDGDGVADLILPKNGRRSLQALRFAGGPPAVLDSETLPAALTGALSAATGPDGALVVRAPVEGGTVVEWRPAP
ncbi:MAG: hypothetical protein TEF_05115 [Rhizobiales bacterium NRL2]|jgi:hypothetical protein|nr:MAG: hypothetical protein TEF_05115 [Rhizobiales bacterium NRL2]